jgi:hypothetical protein
MVIARLRSRLALVTEEPRKAHVRAVPWTTPTEEKVKGALGEIPAYVRRARRVEDAVEALHREAAEIREEMLRFVVLRRKRVEESDDPRALEALRTSIRRFNRRWEAWIREEAPIDRVNDRIDGYNRHYRMERQCALKYVPLDKVAFTPKERITPESLLEEYPLLPLP